MLQVSGRLSATRIQQTFMGQESHATEGNCAPEKRRQCASVQPVGKGGHNPVNTVQHCQHTYVLLCCCVRPLQSKGPLASLDQWHSIAKNSPSQAGLKQVNLRAIHCLLLAQDVKALILYSNMGSAGPPASSVPTFLRFLFSIVCVCMNVCGPCALGA